MQCFIKCREKKKYLWKSEWKSTEKPATASLNSGVCGFAPLWPQAQWGQLGIPASSFHM